jgi:hypothetical protein
LPEEVFISQPPGIKVPGKEAKVYKLHKALYGLKQAPRACYERIDKYLKDNGWGRSMNEPTVYTKRSGSSDIIPMCLYVDDIIYTSSSSVLIDEFKRNMVSEFEMKDIGELKLFLGLEVLKKSDGLVLLKESMPKTCLKSLVRRITRQSQLP